MRIAHFFANRHTIQSNSLIMCAKLLGNSNAGNIPHRDYNFYAN